MMILAAVEYIAPPHSPVSPRWRAFRCRVASSAIAATKRRCGGLWAAVLGCGYCLLTIGRGACYNQAMYFIRTM